MEKTLAIKKRVYGSNIPLARELLIRFSERLDRNEQDALLAIVKKHMVRVYTEVPTKKKYGDPTLEQIIMVKWHRRNFPEMSQDEIARQCGLSCGGRVCEILRGGYD